MSRARRLAVLLLLAAAVLAVFDARAGLAATATVTLSLSSAAVPVDTPVTMTATVASAAGVPTGSVSFVNAATGGTIGQMLLMQSSLNSAIASLPPLTLPAGTYSIYAEYAPDWNAWGLGLATNVRSTSQTLTVGTTTPVLTPTQVILSGPTSVDSTAPVTLTATVSEVPPGATPTGTVQFVDMISGSPIAIGPATVPLVNGAAQVVQTFAIGAHKILATYGGGGGDASSSSQPLFLTSSAPVDIRVQTFASVAVSPAQIASGDTTTITATILQATATGTAPATGGTVTFSAARADGYAVNLGSAPLGSAGQAVIQSSTLPPGSYTITASYFGNLYLPSGNTATLSVLQPRPAAQILYAGSTTAVYGHTATLAATVTDPLGTPLAGRVVSFTLGAQTCNGTTNANGRASCSLVVAHDPGSTSVSISVPGDVQTLANTAVSPFDITSEVTSISTSAQLGAVTTALTGTLLAGGAPFANQTITLALDAGSCNATTDAAGVATCSVPSIAGQPSANLTASYAGTIDYLPVSSSQTVPLTFASSLAYTGATTGAYHGTANFSATLTVTSGAVAGRTVTFTLGSQNCSGATNATGVASCSISPIAQDVQSYTLAVGYAGDFMTLPSSATSPFAVTRAPTTLSAAVPTAGASVTTLTVTLTETASGAPLTGKPVMLSLGPSSCPATTDAGGIASCSVPTPSGLSATLTTAFDGDPNYVASSDTKTVPLLRPTVTSYTGATSGDYHDSATLAAKLVDATGPVSGKTLTLTVGSQSCQAITDLAGTASCGLLGGISQAPGSYPVTVTFAGEGPYLPSNASATFTVTPEQTTAVAMNSGPVLHGLLIALTGKLLEDGLTPIAGRSLTLSLGTQSCTATTSLLGIATCTVPGVDPLGPTSSSARFVSDGFYLPASDTTPALLYAFAPGGGAFVVGDLTASGAVTFWSPQWWKVNRLSFGAPAPASFKGYASSWSKACGATWTTRPGESSRPPEGPLPSYMAVIVSDRVTKSGTQINGTTTHVVIVNTQRAQSSGGNHEDGSNEVDRGGDHGGNSSSSSSAGDQNGKPGTGTVVATVC